MITTTPTHEQERQAILKEYPLTYFIAAAALFIGIGILIGAVLFGQNSPLADQDNNYFSNVYLTIISTAFTVIVIDRLNRRRDEQRDLRQLQEQLVRDASSTSNETAKNGVHQIGKRGWLRGEDGLLKGVNLVGSKLQGANLSDANLQSVNLYRANLQEAKLSRANLQDANLVDADLLDVNLANANLQAAKLKWADLQNAFLPEANLQDTFLPEANLQATYLLKANLRGATLWGANLQRTLLMEAYLCDADLSSTNLQAAKLVRTDLRGTILKNANLQDAILRGANLNEETTLPDGTNWTPDTDMTRFTDPHHPNFWRSDNPHSPAYRRADAAPTATPPPEP